MNWWKDPRVILGAGAGLALIAGLVIALILIKGDKTPPQAPPAATGGLVVQTGKTDDTARLNPNKPLRCFVGGQFIGELPLAQCAQRNGVATGALDVGLDRSGNLSASNGATANLTPLPSPSAASDAPTVMLPPGQIGVVPRPPATATSNSTPEPASGGAECWRYAGGNWRKLPMPVPLTACVQALYADRCEPANDAAYGRWGEQTLRLTDGRIEVSPDNHSFHTLIDPWPGCSKE